MDPVEVKLVAPVHQGDGHGHDHGPEAGAEVDGGGEDGVVRPQRAGAGVQEAEVTRETVFDSGKHPDQSETSISNIDQSETSIIHFVTNQRPVLATLTKGRTVYVFSLRDQSEASILVSRDPS